MNALLPRQPEPPAPDAGWTKFALVTALKAVPALLVVFVLVRIVIPDLIDAHDTALAFAALGCAVVALLILAWLGVSVWRSYRRVRPAAGAPMRRGKPK